MSQDGFALCERIASVGRNNLWQAARRLSDPERYRFFLATYASMRWIDDQVDDGFLALPRGERVARRGEFLHRIETWRAWIGAAFEGRFQPGPEVPSAEIYAALQEVVRHADLGPWPWHLLADSLRRDVAEEPVLTWEDFFAYCEGATVAPAAVFLFLLGWEKGSDGRLSFGSQERLRGVARRMGRFCYLVHILRDLRLDAARADQLLSVPRELLEGNGLSVDAFKQAVLRGDAATVQPVLDAFLDVATTHRDAALADAAALTARFSAESREILAGLLSVYDAMLVEMGTGTNKI
ncbi:MAG TPA: squalene/phytoene synthase family protein [Candidatus Polarisedimenticolaceae bacterium]|nr:squalene/phytoene synthase family protein [Candidatus Polarisedimenticolaceae bacterium]